jgi:hypothetical protein
VAEAEVESIVAEAIAGLALRSDGYVEISAEDAQEGLKATQEGRLELLRREDGSIIVRIWENQ